MIIKADTIRCENDLSLYKKLKQHEDVKRVNALIERREAESTTSIRRNLLSSSVRLTKGMSPLINKMAQECIELLDVKMPVELFVYSSPQFNAACFKPEEERLYIMFSSSLLEGFDEQELKFVMGHELGHHVYRHHDIPIGYLLNGKMRPSSDLVLQLFAWSRYAEISADRAGAHCAQDTDAVARSFFKLSSGLTSKNIVKFSLDDFVAQVDDMQLEEQQPGQGAPQADWFSTHPFSPLRVKALKLFEQSDIYIANPHSVKSVSKTELETGVQAIMSLMEPSYLEAKTDTAEAMRRLLFTGLICVADADGEISDKELELFESFFGEYSFSEKLDIEKTKKTLDRRIAEVNQQASQTQIMQVLHDMCLMAKADGFVKSVEKQVLERIATRLGVSQGFVHQSLDNNTFID